MERRETTTRQSALYIAYLGVGILALIVLPAFWGTIDAGVDSSWQYALNKFISFNGLKYGKDLFFTYGPMGFLCAPMTINNGIWYALIIYGLSYAGLVWGMYKIVLANRKSIGSIIVGILMMFFSIPTASSDSFLLLCGITAYIMMWKNPDSWINRIYYTYMVTVILLYKTSMVAAVIGAMLVALFMGLFIKKIKNVWYFLCPLFCFVLVFMVHSFSLKGFVDYIKYALIIAEGYSTAMSLQIIKAHSYMAGVVVAAILYAGALLVLLIKKDIDNLANLLIIGPALFVAYKHGCVRCDGVHIAWAMSEMFSVLAIAIIACDFSKYSPKMVCLINSYLVITVVFVVYFINSVGNISPLANIKDRGNSWHMIATNSANSFHQQQIEELDYMPSEFAQIIGDKTFTSFPWDIQFIEEQEINSSGYMPLPTLQAYVAFTPQLDKLVSDFFVNSQPEYIVMDNKEIDFRLFGLDVPSTWNAIVDRYEVEKYIEKDHLFLLHRREEELSASKAECYESITLGSDERIVIPDWKWVKLETGLNTKGRIQKLLWNVPPVKLAIEYDDGEVIKGRVLLDNICEGANMEIIPRNEQDIYEILNNGKRNSIQAVYLFGDGLECYSNRINVLY